MSDDWGSEPISGSGFQAELEELSGPLEEVLDSVGSKWCAR